MQLIELLAAGHPDSAGTGAGLVPTRPPAILVLADGTTFEGFSVGAAGTTVGEVVFNTAMTGYQEILTDPSYCNQIITLTYPHIGNTGWNPEDNESARIQAAGLIVRDLPNVVSNFRSQQTLSSALQEAGCVAISGIDTRALTRRLRDGGAQAGCILAAGPGVQLDPQGALRQAQTWPGLLGQDLAQHVSTPTPYPWRSGSWSLEEGHPERFARGPRVIAFDYGVKRNILRLLADRGCELTVVPAKTSFEEAMSMGADGLFLSNGPGDPRPCDYAIAVARAAMAARVPLFGICLGHQILALAAGANTYKMKFGHHGANHPVKELATGRVFITSQNHGFAVEAESLPAHLTVTHVSLFDGSIQGLAHRDAPAFCFQGHPEASPGPHDIVPLFDQFFAAMRGAHAKAD